jgi:hypothetical protein
VGANLAALRGTVRATAYWLRSFATLGMTTLWRQRGMMPRSALRVLVTFQRLRATR